MSHSHGGHSHADGGHSHSHGEDHSHCISGKFEAPLEESLIKAELNGITVVVAPAAEADAVSKTQCIVICTDIFGHELPNVQILAKELAASCGVEVYIPDLCKGDACAPTGFDFSQLPQWFSRHGDSDTMPVLSKVLAALRAGGKTRIMTLGFCWGARYAVLPAHGPTPLVDAFGVAHPTKTSPKDYIAASEAGVPGLFLLAETDGMFSPEAVAETKEGVAGSKATYVFEGPYPGTNHGFVVRGDDSVPAVAEGRAAARAAIPAFFKQIQAQWTTAPLLCAATGDHHGHSHGVSCFFFPSSSSSSPSLLITTRFISCTHTCTHANSFCLFRGRVTTMVGTAMVPHLHQRHQGVGGTLTVGKNALGMGMVVRRVRVGGA